ncbi:RluA family pseudouridine synthase [Lagierella sp.]|uniref:RluA family pseudouridine synthase n=1 Tax=Lagierella sp. TaxID=2849657 RepID=UPI0026389210|nr:RluA family pseudouridine synthase [Lagierella sp.]
MKKIKILIKEDSNLCESKDKTPLEFGRIDKYLSEYMEDYTRSYIKSLIKAKKVFVNDKIIKPSYILKIGDSITVELPEDDTFEILPENKPLDVIYEDQFLAILNKPPHLIVHPTQSIKSGTLVNRLKYWFENLSDIYAPFRPGIVHRLDKDTTGLIVIAKDNVTHEKLKDIFKARKIEKHYVAIVQGTIDEKIVIEKPIGRDLNNRTKMAVDEELGKYAKSIVLPLEYNEDYSSVDVEILTGRTHQIRVHLSSIHHPILGDRTYGLKKEKVNATRQMLHAYFLKFCHPITGKMISVGALPGEEFITILKKCNLDKNKLYRHLDSMEVNNG